MKPEEKELLKYKDDIKDKLKDIFKKYFKIFELDIPEADEEEISALILQTMQKALDELKSK